MTIKSSLARFIHSHGILSNIAYGVWKKIYGPKERFSLPSSRQKTRDNGFGAQVYPMDNLSIAITEHCNSRCVFCVHPRIETPKIAMSDELFDRIMSAWSRFDKSKRFVNLTPSGPPGEPLIDPGFVSKLKIMQEYGYKAFFVTNAIALHKHIDTIIYGGNVGAIGISLPSFDKENYKEIYRVDRGVDVTRNIFMLLEASEKAGWPVDITLNFRNSLKPAQIIDSPDYKRLKKFFNDRCRTMFTTWWDDWNGTVPKEEMERGEIRIRKPINLRRVCEGAQGFSMRPTDDKIRLCGCRILAGVDDLIVGDINEGFLAAQMRAKEIQEGFKIGKRPKTCQDCGAYKQA